jgi:hypothetical protein
MVSNGCDGVAVIWMTDRDYSLCMRTISQERRRMPRTCNITRRCSVDCRGKCVVQARNHALLRHIWRHAMVVWEMDGPHRENASVLPALCWKKSQKAISVAPRSERAMHAPRTAYKYIAKVQVWESKSYRSCIVGAHNR